MLNYLLRRRNPTPFTIVQTTEIILYGENLILTGFRSHPPEWIAVVHRAVYVRIAHMQHTTADSRVADHRCFPQPRSGDSS